MHPGQRNSCKPEFLNWYHQICDLASSSTLHLGSQGMRTCHQAFPGAGRLHCLIESQPKRIDHVKWAWEEWLSSTTRNHKSCLITPCPPGPYKSGGLLVIKPLL